MDIRKLCNNIKVDCLELIKQKNVDLEELSFELGVSLNKFIDLFKNNEDEYLFYFKTYNLLIEWC